MSRSEELAVGTVDSHDVTFGRVADNLGDRARKHPRVESQQGLFPALFEVYLGPNENFVKRGKREILLLQ